MRILLSIAIALYASAAAAEIYSWKDAEGRMHYSDRPPDGKTPSLKVVPDTVGTTIPKLEPPARPPAKDAAKKDATAKATAPSPQAACDKAKADLQAFEEEPRRAAVSKGAKGTRINAVDGEERAAREAEIRKAIEENCK